MHRELVEVGLHSEQGFLLPPFPLRSTVYVMWFALIYDSSLFLAAVLTSFSIGSGRSQNRWRVEQDLLHSPFFPIHSLFVLWLDLLFERFLFVLWLDLLMDGSGGWPETRHRRTSARSPAPIAPAIKEHGHDFDAEELAQGVRRHQGLHNHRPHQGQQPYFLKDLDVAVVKATATSSARPRTATSPRSSAPAPARKSHTACTLWPGASPARATGWSRSRHWW